MFRAAEETGMGVNPDVNSVRMFSEFSFPFPGCVLSSLVLFLKKSPGGYILGNTDSEILYREILLEWEWVLLACITVHEPLHLRI